MPLPEEWIEHIPNVKKYNTEIKYLINQNVFGDREEFDKIDNTDVRTVYTEDLKKNRPQSVWNLRKWVEPHFASPISLIQKLKANHEMT